MSSTPDLAHADALDALDEALTSVRRLLQRPGYKRRFFAALGEPVELGTFRAVRAVQRLGDARPGVGAVAELLGVDASTASRSVDRAVTEGYLRREPSVHDGRRTQLALTPRGVELLDRAQRARRELLGEVTRAWEVDELAHLADLLERLRADLDELER